MQEQSPLIVGISGGSASGKTTLARRLQEALTNSLSTLVYQDSYYKDRRGCRLEDVNFDHPSAIDFDLLVEHLVSLKKGEAVNTPCYCFKTHARLPQTMVLEARPLILLDGILIFSDARIRELLDFKVFVQTGEALRFQRRMKRDVAERGRTPDEVESQFTGKVKPMHDLFVEPSRQYADRVFSGERCFSSVEAEVLAWVRRRFAERTRFFE